jgi:hypothetical protein
LLPPPSDPGNKGVVSISHLNAVFGLLEVVFEALEYWGDDAPEGFKDALLDYCYYYSATKAEQVARYGKAFSDISLLQAHSRLMAYFANQRKNSTVAERAWTEFYTGDGFGPDLPWSSRRLNSSGVLMPSGRSSMGVNE